MRRRVYLAGFVVHFFLLLAVCWRDTFVGLAETRERNGLWKKAQEISATALGENLSVENPLRAGVAGYLHCAGIQSGYGFFAPNIPSSHKLVFELHYRDGRTEYELPHVSNDATGFRLVSLLDQIARITYEPLRAFILQRLAYSILRGHREADSIRAVFGYVDVPSLREAARGENESYHFLFAYDFSLPAQPEAERRH